MSTARRLVLAALLCALPFALALVACGKVGPPVRRLPAAAATPASPNAPTPAAPAPADADDDEPPLGTKP